MLKGEEEERRRISRELHDETGQALMVLRFQLEMLASNAKNSEQQARVEESLEVLDRTIEGLRRIIARLSPRVLEELGLLAAIRRQAQLLANQTGMKARLDLPAEIAPMNHDIEVAVYRSTQEALHNISKHSQARNFTVRLYVAGGKVQQHGCGKRRDKQQSAPGQLGAFPQQRRVKREVMPIRCLIVDDHTLFREGLRRVLESEPDLQVVGEARDGSEAIEQAQALKPDVVLLDIGMPGLSSFEASRRITRELPGRRVIFLTMYEDEEYLLQCLDAGASGYILKDAPAPRLIGAVRDVNAGRKYLSPQVLGKLVDDFRSRSTTGMARGSTLTPREREVIKMLAEGNSVRQIASILGLSVKTVEAHKFNLMRKLNIHNKAQLVTYAIQKKIVKMPAGA